MREIKFRGKVHIGYYGAGEWYYFDLEEAFCDDNTNFIDFDTVGQYTGLKDKNGVEIYEGDIVKIDYTPLECCKHYEIGHISSVDWCKDGYGNIVYGLVFNGKILYDQYFNTAKIIGNIYENPELN